MRNCIKILLFFPFFIISALSPVNGGVYHYVIDRDGDDGMELNHTTWLKSGFSVDDPVDFMGEKYGSFRDIGLRFHLEEQNQGDQFLFARIWFVSAASLVQSGLDVLIQGVDLDGVSAFSQSNRPSQQTALTDAEVGWDISGWNVSGGPFHYCTPDIAPIINEILSRPGWGTGPEGKTIAVLLENSGQAASEINQVGVNDFSEGQWETSCLELFNSAVDTFIGGPVLSKPASTSISVSLISVIDSDYYIEFGTSPGNYTDAIGNSQTELPDLDPVMGQEANHSRELGVKGLDPCTRYYYRLRARQSGSVDPYESGPEYSFITRRPPGESFNFAFLADSHVGHGWIFCPDCWILGQRTIENAREAEPDFFIVGGDEACTDGIGFPIGDCDEAEVHYAFARCFYGPLANTAPIFLVLGNHEGEGSFHPAHTRECSYQARSNYFYNPDAATYSFGGGPKENYFAWEWGDALFVCLDIFSYTGPVDPKYIQPYGSGWHLGRAQLMWLKWVLSSSQARWKFIFAHHVLASWAFDGYGRGGAKYAHEYEQGAVHQLMKDYGAQIFFYGHDHVFAHGAADGIHYALASQCFGIYQPSWTLPYDPAYPYFLDAYPGGFLLSKGHINVRVHPRSAWVDYVRSSLDGQNGMVVYSYHLADVQVKVTPPSDTEIPGELLASNDLQLPDSQAFFSAVFSNTTKDVQTFDRWVRVAPPSGMEYRTFVEENRSLGPGECRKVNYRIDRAAIVRPGIYTYTVEAGDYPDEVISMDSFSVEVLP